MSTDTLFNRPCESWAWGRCGYCYTCRLAKDTLLLAKMLELEEEQKAAALFDDWSGYWLARVRELEKTLNKIAGVMRRREPDDFLLSEIQDYLTMAGYDVPLRSYRDAALGPTRHE